MLIRPPEIKVKCADLYKAFRELKPDCGSAARINRYNSQIPGMDYLGIRPDCIFCIDKDKEEMEYKSVAIKAQGAGILFILPHILRDILKVTDKDSEIVLYPHRIKKDWITTVYADGCTWELNSLPLEEFPIGIFPKEPDTSITVPDKQVKATTKPARKAKQVKTVAKLEIEQPIDVTDELSGLALADLAKSILMGA